MIRSFLHPALQCVATLASLLALWTGVQRFRSCHLHQKVLFPWKKHVRFGMIALLGWLLGSIVLVIFVDLTRGWDFPSYPHGQIGLAMVPLILIGLASGLVLNKTKKNYRPLMIVHGLINTVLVVVAVYQVLGAFL